MLPEKAGTVILSAESARKLDIYYRRFCEGPNNELYGLSHIVFACHASFPLLLTPELTNLVWLNFRNYSSQGALASIDRVVVSDFLLSPLVRSVAANQFEVIPDIRNYLLYLLKDSRWFSLFGIGVFGDKRLTELAEFLQQYLQQKKDVQDNTISGFRQVNEWAALAYLEPDKLAYKMATAFKDTFDDETKARKDEPGQLRINMLVNKFGQQLESGIHAATADKREAFINLQLYSNANSAVLFGKQEMADALLLKLDNTFIGEISSTSELVLPVQKDIGERLERKKNNIQKVRSLLICNERDERRAPGAFVSTYGLTRLQDLLRQLESSGSFDTKDTTDLRHEVTKAQIQQAIEALFRDANPEDICFVYFAGFRGSDKENNPAIYTSGQGEIPEDSINKQELTEMVRTARGNKKQQLVLFLDINGAPDNPWMTGDDIVLYAVRDLYESHYDSSSEEANTAFNDVLTRVLSRTAGRMTYSDLQRYLNYTIKHEFGQTSSGAVLQASGALGNQYFLSYEKAEPDDKFVMVYNRDEKVWHVLEEDFVLTTLNSNTSVFRYPEGSRIGNTKGEFFKRELVQYSGNTDQLQQEELYKGWPERRSLSCKVIAQKIPEDAAAILNKPLQFDVFSKWGRLGDYDQITDKNAFIHELLEESFYETLVVELTAANNTITWHLSYYEKQYNEQPQPLITVRNVNGDQFATILQKMIRYVYLRQLGVQTTLGWPYEPLLVDVDCAWDTPGSNAPLPKDNSFVIEEEAIVISGSGEITLKSFRISLFNNENFPVFYDVYLLFPDLSIVRLEREMDMIQPDGSVTLFAEQPALLKKLADDPAGLLLKTLFSRNPIQPDFSQTGSN